MQGIHDFISTKTKTDYLNLLLGCGFDTLDFGSFVSPKAIPQLADTTEVLAGLDLANTSTKLLAIVANIRGAETACLHDEISYLGFPFSVSETFQQRNTNSSIADSINAVAEMQNLCLKHTKELVVYLSMGFGNHYGDPWNADVLIHWTDKMDKMGVKILALSDTIGTANPDSISAIFSSLIPAYPHIEFGAHLHTTPDRWREKVQAAWDNGCRRFDGAVKGFGGCPMATNTLTGNMPTENLLAFCKENNIETGVDSAAFQIAFLEANKVFLG